MKNWYEGKTGNHQGLVIEESTGKNIAVIYDKADAALIAAAPELLAALESLEQSYLCCLSGSTSVTTWREVGVINLRVINAAISKAKGGE